MTFCLFVCLRVKLYARQSKVARILRRQTSADSDSAAWKSQTSYKLGRINYLHSRAQRLFCNNRIISLWDVKCMDTGHWSVLSMSGLKHQGVLLNLCIIRVAQGQTTVSESFWYDWFHQTFFSKSTFFFSLKKLDA